MSLKDLAQSAWRNRDSIVLGGLFGATAGLMYVRGMVRNLEDERHELRDTAASLRRRNAQLTALSNVFTQVAQDLSVDAVVLATVRETLRFMDADLVTLRKLIGDRLVPYGAMARGGREVQVYRDVALGQGITGEAARDGRTIRISRDAELLMRPPAIMAYPPSPSEQLLTIRNESGIIVPLIVGSKLIGTLACWSQQVDAFTEDDERILEMMGSQVATAMMAADTMEETTRKAHFDSLTDLPNRLQLNRDLEGVLAELATNGRCAVFAMADIDDFKGYNDEFGHSSGDQALKQVAGVLSDKRAGAPDLAYRFGGDEFLIVFLESTLERALEQAEELRLRIKTEVEPQGRLSLSLGLASLPEHSTQAAALIEMADAALYRAKNSGRDRVCSWDSSLLAA